MPEKASTHFFLGLSSMQELRAKTIEISEVLQKMDERLANLESNIQSGMVAVQPRERNPQRQQQQQQQ